MTKQDFLNGTEFKLKTTDINTYALRECNVSDSQYIVEINYSSNTGKKMFEKHELNIDKIGRVGFNGYNFIMGRQIKVKFRFEDLVS